MRITTAHFFRGVSNPAVNEPLVNSLHDAEADEAVPEKMPSPHHLPLALRQSPFQVIMDFIFRDRSGHCPFLFALLYLDLLTEKIWPTRMDSQPFPEDT